MASGNEYINLNDLKVVYDHLKNAMDAGGLYNNVVNPPALAFGSASVSSNKITYSDSATECLTGYNSDQGASTVFLVEPGTVFHLTDPEHYQFRQIYAAYSATDTDPNVGIKWYIESYKTTDITIPSGRQRRVILGLQAKPNSGTTITTTEGLNQKIQIKLPNMYSGLDGELYKNFSLKDHLELNGALPSDGAGIVATGTAYSGCSITHFIPVRKDMNIAYGLVSEGRYVMCFYDTNLVFNSGVVSGTGTVTVPVDGFVRFSVDASSTDNYVCFSDYGIPDRVEQELVQIETDITDINQELALDTTEVPSEYKQPTVKNAVTHELGTDYMRTAVARIAGQLKAKAELGNIVTFGFNTDQHVVSVGHENYDSITKPVLRGMKAMSMLTHEFPYDFICLGGDACNSAAALAGTYEEILGQCIDIQKPLYDAWCPVIPIPGNHEATQNNKTMLNGMLFNAYSKRIANTGLLTFWNHKGNNPDPLITWPGGPLEAWSGGPLNAYWDSKIHKIRFIFFDSCFGSGQVATNRDYGSTGRNNALTGLLSTTPQGYHVVIISHHALSTELNSVDSTLWNATNCNCQNILLNHADKIICCICGHNHADVSYTSDVETAITEKDDQNNDVQVTVHGSILYIATTNAQQANDFNGHSHVLNTETETAFDTFVIDQEAKKIYAFRYGKGHVENSTGPDREWSYNVGWTRDE